VTFARAAVVLDDGDGKRGMEQEQIRVGLRIHLHALEASAAEYLHRTPSPVSRSSAHARMRRNTLSLTSA
jgi:hypothetical protein